MPIINQSTERVSSWKWCRVPKIGPATDTSWCGISQDCKVTQMPCRNQKVNMPAPQQTPRNMDFVPLYSAFARFLFIINSWLIEWLSDSLLTLLLNAIYRGSLSISVLHNTTPIDKERWFRSDGGAGTWISNLWRFDLFYVIHSVTESGELVIDKVSLVGWSSSDG